MAHELDLDGLMARANVAAQRWHRGVELVEPTRLTGGASSITYWARVMNGPSGVDKVVLKWAPPGLEPVRNRDVLRQARCLRSVASLGAVVPSIYFDDAGAPTEIPPMFAMTFVDGDSCEPNLDAEPVLPTPADLRTRALSSAHILAALHNLRPDRIGLADEPEVSISDEIDRWAAALKSVPDDFCPGAEELEARLRAKMPAPMASSVIHGDFRLGNMLCVGPDVLAVIDWEIWARSDPRIDLGWYLLNAGRDRHGLLPRADALQDERGGLAHRQEHDQARRPRRHRSQLARKSAEGHGDGSPSRGLNPRRRLRAKDCAAVLASGINASRSPTRPSGNASDGHHRAGRPGSLLISPSRSANTANPTDQCRCAGPRTPPGASARCTNTGSRPMLAAMSPVSSLSSRRAQLRGDSPAAT
jgi:aminoglycoside phosphotransferase (APT) family kinase protein